MGTTFGTSYLFLDDRLLAWMDWNPSTNKYQLLYTYGVPPDDGL
jgi:hypothetical protein